LTNQLSMPLRDGRIHKRQDRSPLPSGPEPKALTAIAAIAWYAGLTLAGYLWAQVLLRRDLNR
jgi:hypothetical protein